MLLRGIFGRPALSGSKQVTALDVIREAEYPLIATQWKGTPVLVKCRELSEVQIRACGNFSLIDLGELYKGPFNWKRFTAYSDVNYKILKASLESPTYDEIFAIIGNGPMIATAEAQFREIEKLLLDMPKGPKRQRYEQELDMLRCQFDLILPEDFIAPIIAYAVGLMKSDIKKITHEMLLDAAILAEKGHDNPADHISGMFTDFNRDDINSRAWVVYHDWLKEEKSKRGKRARHVG